jgi:hypothetical protein
MSLDKGSERFQPGLLDHEVDCARMKRRIRKLST